MYNEMFSKVYDHAEAFVAPMTKANQLAVSNFEKVMALHMDSLHYYLDIGFKQLKDATEIKSPQSAQVFFNRQMEVATAVRQRMIDDTKALFDMGNGFKEEFTKLAENNVKEFNKEMKEIEKEVKAEAKSATKKAA